MEQHTYGQHIAGQHNHAKTTTAEEYGEDGAPACPEHRPRRMALGVNLGPSHCRVAQLPGLKRPMFMLPNSSRVVVD